MRSQFLLLWFVAILVSFCSAFPESKDKKKDVEPEMSLDLPDSEYNETALMEELFVLSRAQLDQKHPLLNKEKKGKSKARGREARQAIPITQNDRLPDMRILEPLLDYNPFVNETASDFIPLAAERKRRASDSEKERTGREVAQDDDSASGKEISSTDTTETPAAFDEYSTLAVESSEPISESGPVQTSGGNASLPENSSKTEDELDGKVQIEMGDIVEVIGDASALRDVETFFGEGNRLEGEVLFLERIRREIEDERTCPKDEEEETKTRNKELAEKAEEEAEKAASKS